MEGKKNARLLSCKLLDNCKGAESTIREATDVHDLWSEKALQTHMDCQGVQLRKRESRLSH
jgi:hypothetical protein